MNSEATRVVRSSASPASWTLRVVPSWVIFSTLPAAASSRSWLYEYDSPVVVSLMNVQRTASPKTARTTSTTLLRTMRLVKMGLLSPPCDRCSAHGRHQPSTMQVAGRASIGAPEGPNKQPDLDHTSPCIRCGSPVGSLDSDAPLPDRCDPATAELDPHPAPTAFSRLEQRLDALRTWRGITDRHAQYAPTKGCNRRLAPVNLAIGTAPACQLRRGQLVEKDLIIRGTLSELTDTVHRSRPHLLEDRHDLGSNPVAQEGRILVRRIK